MLQCTECGAKAPDVMIMPREYVMRRRKTPDGEGEIVYRTTKPKKVKCGKCGKVDFLWHFQYKKYQKWKSAKRGRKAMTIQEKVNKMMGVE